MTTSAPDPDRAPGPGPSRPRPSRRAVLTGGLIGSLAALAGAAELVEQDVLPGRVAAARLLGQDGAPGSIPAGPIGAVRRGSFRSAARAGTTTNWVIAYPPGVDPDRRRSSTARLPVCVVLHGRGDSAAAMLSLGYPQILAAAVRSGGPAFALASIDGGQQYWHRRRVGGDPGAMVINEYLPRLAAAGLAARPQDRIGFLGWSMGGYGSLLLASELGPARVAAIVAESPALWLRPGDSAPGAFDDAADFRAHDVFDRRSVLGRIPIKIDCGTADPFHTASKRFAAGLHPRPVLDLSAGDHNGGYWRAKAPAAIKFLGAHLAPNGR